MASKQFERTSRAGRYGDAVEELDWSVGEVMECLRENGLDDNTLVIFTSDNGPAIKFTPNNGGSAGHLRGGKGSGWEGGFRVPGIFRLPSDIPAGSVCMEIGTQLDLLPTIASLCGAKVPEDRPIDGVDLMPMLTGKQKSSAASSAITAAAVWRHCARAGTRPSSRCRATGIPRRPTCRIRPGSKC